MYISAREREIIDLLIENINGISVGEVATKINVSNRTVYRELKGIEDILQKFELTLTKLPLKGLSIEGAESKINELRESLLNHSQEFTQRERGEYILFALLKESESLKLTTLANELNVTVATVSNDLTKVEDWLEMFDLKVIRKKGYGITLEGSEKQKRKALGSLISEKINEYEFMTHGVSKNFAETIKLEKMTMVGKLIRSSEEQLSYFLADTSYLSLTIHLSLALERILQGELITMEPELLDELKKAKEFKMANQIAQGIKEIFLIDLPIAEIGYITIHLQGARVREKNEDAIRDGNIAILTGTKKLIQLVSEQMGINFEKEHHLFQDIVTHIEPAIYRIQKKLEVKNPLANQIQNDYPQLFQAIQNGLKLAFPTIEFNYKEVAYLVLHFGSSKEAVQPEANIKALVICSSGIGSSKMLASRIKKEIKEITELDVISLYDLKDIEIDQYPLILSTIEMPGFSEKYLQVSPLLTSEDVKQIQREIQTLPKRVRDVSKVKELTALEPIKQRIEKIYHYSETAMDILNIFRHYHLSANQEIQILLSSACELLAESGYIQNASKTLAALLERQEKGGLGIPETELALYHCRCETVEKPLFVVFTLEEPITLEAMDGKEVTVVRLLLLLAPTNVSTTQLEVLSDISATIIDNEEIIRIFTYGSEKEISHRLAYVFDKKLKNNFK